MRAALYSRFSTDRQKGASIEDQFRVCERLAEQNGFAVVARFSDAAISGGTTQRPQYQALLAGSRPGDFKLIVLEGQSRRRRHMSSPPSPPSQPPRLCP